VVVKIGTRKSKLAMWQANHVKARLEAHGVHVELVPIETKGDKVLNTSIAKIGSKGVFTEELEQMLLDSTIDIAVHSAKDLQSDLGESFEIIAFSEREKASDVIVSHKPIDLDTEGLVIGTSSTRRVALFKRFYPHLKIVDMRGNLQTRIKKMEEGECDALVLAYAGVSRMGYEGMIKEYLSFENFIPAVGQGALAIEASISLNTEKKDLIRKVINHEPTEKLLLAERSYLKKLEGGCSIPVFAMANYTANGAISIKGGIVSLDGTKLIEREVQGRDPEDLGEELATQVLAEGGDKILKSIKEKI